ncbi:hypothetical protein Tco_0708967, partial [Tanacetum coccineum]
EYRDDKKDVRKNG